jgi:hypothetical protein
MVTHYPMTTLTVGESAVTEIDTSIMGDVRVWIAVAVILAIYWWIRWRN